MLNPHVFHSVSLMLLEFQAQGRLQWAAYKSEDLRDCVLAILPLAFHLFAVMNDFLGNIIKMTTQPLPEGRGRGWVIIPIMDHVITLILQPVCPVLIIRNLIQMTAAIDFND